MQQGVATYSYSDSLLKGGDYKDAIFSQNGQIDYYPFGMLMPGRNGQEDDYRYGYQGSESDDEVHGTKGSSYTTHFRQLDTRIGRWLSYDPKSTAWESPYVSMGNNPIWLNDQLGGH